MRGSCASATPVAMAVLDAVGRLVSADEAFAGLTGYERHAIAGVHLRDLFFVADRVLAALEARAGQWRGEAILTRNDGSTAPLSLSITRLQAPLGVCTGFLVEASPLRPQDDLDRVPLARRAPLAIGLVHQLRNVLLVISTNAELIERGDDGRGIRQRLALIRDAASSGVELLEEAAR